ncbi:MAG: PIN domain-containing protein [Nocardioidaceae bacterium]
MSCCGCSGSPSECPRECATHSPIRDIAAEELAVSSRHALIAGTMSWAHRDPFDRMLAAQSLIENAILVTTDAALAELPGLRVLGW